MFDFSVLNLYSICRYGKFKMVNSLMLLSNISLLSTGLDAWTSLHKPCKYFCSVSKKWDLKPQQWTDVQLKSFREIKSSLLTLWCTDTRGLPYYLSSKIICLKCRRCRRCRFDSRVRKIPLKEGMATHHWPREFHGQRRLVGYGPQNHKESDMMEVTEQQQYWYQKQ